MRDYADAALVSLVDMYLFFDRGDHAYEYVMADPRAQEKVGKAALPPLWVADDVDYEEVWPLKGIGLFSIASMHFWRHGLPFEYIDVGAHVGQTSIAQAIFFKRCGKRNRVHALEPGKVFELLSSAVRLNRVGDMVSCINAAASDQAGEVAFYLTPKQSPAGSMLKGSVTRSEVLEFEQTTAQALTIDSYLANLSNEVGILAKIDTEGADFKVLAGMSHTLRNRLVVAQIELFPKLIDYVNPVAEIEELAKHFLLMDVGAGVSIDQHGVQDLLERVAALPQPSTDIFMISKSVPDARTLMDRILEG